MGYRFDRITVLVVDSQPAMVDLIHGVLKILGVRTVITRTDSQSALDAFKEFEPDLLIVDWDIQGMDGLEFTRTIRGGTVNPFTPIIFMTGFTSKKRVLQARDSGITEFMAKPFTALALYKRIEEIIERPRQFVRTEGFFGPDRRRRSDSDYVGPDKRQEAPIEIAFVDTLKKADPDKKK